MSRLLLVFFIGLSLNLSAQISKKDKSYAAYAKGINALSKDSVQGAVKYFTKAISLDTGNNKAFFYRAKAYIRLKRFNSALYDVNTLVRRKAADAETWFLKGIIFDSLHNYHDALLDYSKSIRLDSTQAEVFFSRGKLHFYANRFEEAIRDFTKAESLRYSDPDLYGMLGFAWSRNNDNKQAAYYYSKAIEANPKDDYYYSGRGFAFIEIGRFQSGYDDLSLFLHNHPHDVIAMYNLARSLNGLGKYQQAIDTFKSIDSIEMGYLDVYFRIGMDYGALGNYSESINWFNKAISQKPDEGLYYYNRAIARLRNKPQEDYCSDLRKAAALKYEEAHKMLSQVCK